MCASGSHSRLMQRFDAATVHIPEETQSGIFTAQLLLHLMLCSCILSFSSAPRGGLVPVPTAAVQSGVAGRSLTFPVTAFAGSPASSSAPRLSELKSATDTGEAQHDGYSCSFHFLHIRTQSLFHPPPPPPREPERWKQFLQEDGQNQKRVACCLVLSEQAGPGAGRDPGGGGTPGALQTMAGAPLSSTPAPCPEPARGRA